MYYTLQKSLLNERPVISGKKIAFFIIGVLSIAVVVSEMTINLQNSQDSQLHYTPKRTLWSKKLHLFLSFFLSCLQISFSLLWIPGVSVTILVKIIGIPRKLALLAVDPLRVFAFFGFTG